MTNAKEEFLSEIRENEVLCASISLNISPWGNDNLKRFDGSKALKVNFTKEDFEDFLNFLDREYDGGYGGQMLYGTIWYKDGTWSERGEYDGSEWWELKQCPEIPENLK